MASLDRNGVKIYYEIHGGGPAILLTHGYSSTSAMWRGQVDVLAKDHTLILWDMRGHGDSDYPEDQSQYSEEHTVADMAALLDVVGAKDAVIGGLSLGGYMSLAFHLRHPDRTKALLIIDTGPGFKKDEPRNDWNTNAERTAKKYAEEGLGLLESATAERRTARHRNARGLELAARGMLAQRDARVISSLPEIKVPSLVVVGSEDKPFLVAADYMANKIPNAENIVIDGAGHAANIDRPKAFNAAIADFLKKHAL
jgi:pimeloyl-ACP methyl ester carboxylesterase